MIAKNRFNMIASRKTKNIGEELNDKRANVLLCVIMGLIANSGAEKKRYAKTPSLSNMRCVVFHVMAPPASSTALGSVLIIDPVECTDEAAVARKFRVNSSR